MGGSRGLMRRPGMKCDTCINSRPVISENGIHSVCCLSARKARNCVFYFWKYYAEHPANKNKGDLE